MKAVPFHCCFWKDFTVQVQLKDHLEIMCPHYEDDRVSDTTVVERYTLFQVEHSEYVACKPTSDNQIRWQCNNPYRVSGPEIYRVRIQKFTASSLGNEFKEGHTYYYISKPIHHHGESCLKLKVHVTGKTTQQPATNVHSPGARAAADDPAVALPDVLRSVAHNSAPQSPSLALCGLLLPLLFALGL
ncbi:ephrin-A1 isoform X2 [Bufo bufo]|uniref:ephrin-A1 isoform X2 n=1 Tax=Bufo bufo TaxID=8384 RepID=UPI001ABE6A5B|nr:ephrin-A1 isoform X2 [Bufo bufo]